MTPPAVLSPLLFEPYRVGGCTFMLKHPLVDKPFDGSAPAWSQVWPGGQALADEVYARWWPAEAEVLELGCGLGLPGMAALAQGLPVTFTDTDETALAFVRSNCLENGFKGFMTETLDISDPPTKGRLWSVILAADLCWNEAMATTLAECLDVLLLTAGIGLVAMRNDSPTEFFQNELNRLGFKWERKKRQYVTLYKVKCFQ